MAQPSEPSEHERRMEEKADRNLAELRTISRLLSLGFGVADDLDAIRAHELESVKDL